MGGSEGGLVWVEVKGLSVGGSEGTLVGWK